MRLILLAIVFITYQLQAQIAAGGKLGVSISDIATNVSDPNAKSKVGFYGGGVCTLGIGNGKIGAVGEVLFTQKGGSNVVSGDVNRFYVEIPVLLRYHISFKDSFPLKLFVNAGPYLGVGFGQRSGGDSFYNKNAGATNAFEFGVAAGLGAMYPVGPGTLFVEVRYNYALTNMVSYTLERNQYTAIAVGYLYQLKAKQTQEEKDKTISPGFE